MLEKHYLEAIGHGSEYDLYELRRLAVMRRHEDNP